MDCLKVIWTLFVGQVLKAKQTVFVGRREYVEEEIEKEIKKREKLLI